MESSNQAKKPTALPPLPSTEKLFSSSLAISPNGKALAYCTNSTVIIRSLENLREAKVYNGHLKETSAVCFDPTGTMMASGDIEGNIKLWNIETMNIWKEKRAFAAKVLGFEFVDNNKRLFVYGYSKNSVKYLLIDTFSGDIDLHNPNRSMLTAAFKNTKPYRIITGSEDNSIIISEGPPFRFQSNKKEHSNFVSCIKFSPDYTRFVSVGFDKKINIWDAAENQVLFSFDTSTPNMHLASIIYAVWIDNNTLATTSVDKTVKIWDLEAKSHKYTLYSVEKANLGEPQVGCGLAYSDSLKLLVALTLDGKLNIWNVENLSEDKTPDVVVHGHQSSVTNVRYAKATDKLVTLDNQGKIIIWDDENNCDSFRPSNLKSNDFDLFANGTQALSVNYNGKFYIVDLVEKKNILEGEIKGDPQRIRPINKKEKAFVILTKDTLNLYENGELAKQIKLLTESQALEVNEVLDEIYVGDNKGKLHVYDMELNLMLSNEVFTEPFYFIRVSNSGKTLALADNIKFIYMMNAETKEMINENFVNHSGKIFDLSFNQDDSILLSCSLDRSVFLWDIAKKTKIIRYEVIDKESCNSATWLKDNCFAVGGSTGIVNKFKYQG